MLSIHNIHKPSQGSVMKDLNLRPLGYGLNDLINIVGLTGMCHIIYVTLNSDRSPKPTIPVFLLA